MFGIVTAAKCLREHRVNQVSVRSNLLRLILAVLMVTVTIAAGVGYWAAERMGLGRRTNVLEVVGTDPVAVMKFSADFSPESLSAGWHHRRFLTRAAMDLKVIEKDGMPVVQCHTQGSASMLVRYVDADLEGHPRLEWRWMVEDGIDSPLDERTVEGDDHPIRLFLRFVNAAGEDNAMEIIWANVHLQRGQWKYLGGFPHYVANGGEAELGRWYAESVDLRDLYRKAWGDPSGVRLTDVALFCDSDETGDATTAYLEYVRLAIGRH